MTEAFIGSWAVERSILDFACSTRIVCRGDAHLQRAGAGLAYDEAVSFRASGKLIHATRAYRYEWERGAIVATFENGAPFFSLELGADGIGRAVHLCGDDLYSLKLTLRAPQTWETRWQVSGTKRLQIATVYERR